MTEWRHGMWDKEREQRTLRKKKRTNNIEIGMKNMEIKIENREITTKSTILVMMDISN